LGRSLGTQNRDRGHEPVSAPRKGFNVTRRVGIIVKRIPNFSDGYAQAVIELNKRVFRPEALPDFLPGDDLSGPLYEHYEQSIRKVLDLHAGAIPRE
jgi:hypothetical protein